ncbi:hypothetical protein GPECTOR_2g1506 [Gonium pectorale]|uniref:Uncharacterized protein n=1 Tax=Gonium pectorale TaxID=33097 RepID=A0A150H1K2_GONPE|nr:hypothetical protein GPECTOR_2g1506 [Gonium pectorale]|eukprot:KXZ55955.1 hypothetical protein GPECTOR_2g1506 [Gonium pectorale]
MDSPGGWGAALDEDVLPSTTAFVAPGQEDLFMLKNYGVDRNPVEGPYKPYRQQQANVLRNSQSELYSDPSAAQLPQQQPPWARAAGGGTAADEAGSHAVARPLVREGGWGAPGAAPGYPPAGMPASPPSAGAASGPPQAPQAKSPQGPSPAEGFGFGPLVAGAMHGAVRHVVDEMRTSPLGPSAASGTPGGAGDHARRGGVAHIGSESAEKNVHMQRYQAQILSLERHNAEVQKRVADLQAALEAAQQSRQVLEAKRDDLLDQVAQANGNAKAKETALETARRANDALSTELRSCQEELAAARDALAASKDTAVQWKDRAMEAAKELEAARKKARILCFSYWVA